MSGRFGGRRYGKIIKNNEDVRIVVSVIIPVFNAEKYIGACIESVINQEADMEIIVVDDGSYDKSGKIVKKYAERYGKIHYFYKNNSGVSEARNFGIEKSKGSYIMFVDADDMLPENAVRDLMDAIEKNQADAVFGNHSYLYQDRNIERVPRLKQGKYSVESLKGKLIDDGTMTGILFGSVCGAIYRRNIIDNLRFCKEIRRNEDGLFNIEYIMRSKTVYVLAAPSVYLYRQWKENEKTILAIDAEARHATARIIQVADGWIGKDELERQIKRRNISVMFWDSLKIAGKDVKFKAAKKYLQKLFEDKTLSESFKSLNYAEMNGYKRVLSYFMKKKRYLLYFTAIHYVYSILVSKVRR